MKTTLESIILEQLKLHSGYAVQDLYKLIYQAIFGVEHFLTDEKAAYRLLSEEFGTVEWTLPGERLLELIDPEGIVHRVNLRPYRRAGGDADTLFEAFLLTRGEVTGTKADFTRRWREATQLTEKLLLPFDVSEMRQLELKLKRGALPVLHHSSGYAERNCPSYRLIAARHLPQLAVG